eukprot:scaffold70515_cov16-Tisochrysis_lutea.AAC.1
MEALIAAGGRGRRGAAYRRQPFLSGHGGVPWDQKPARKQNGWGLVSLAVTEATSAPDCRGG